MSKLRLAILRELDSRIMHVHTLDDPSPKQETHKYICYCLRQMRKESTLWQRLLTLRVYILGDLQKKVMAHLHSSADWSATFEQLVVYSYKSDPLPEDWRYQAFKLRKAWIQDQINNCK